MALLKEIQVNNTGVIAEYWRLCGVQLDFITGQAIIDVAGYLNEEARNTGKAPITKRQIRWSGSENPITIPAIMAGTAFSLAYTKLTQPEVRPMMPANIFEGATLV